LIDNALFAISICIGAQNPSVSMEKLAKRSIRIVFTVGGRDPKHPWRRRAYELYYCNALLHGATTGVDDAVVKTSAEQCSSDRYRTPSAKTMFAD